MKENQVDKSRYDSDQIAAESEETTPLESSAKAFVDEFTDSGASSNRDVITLRPALPDCGVYLEWPAEKDWYHPDDLETLDSLLPSNRVWMRVGWNGEYYHLRYGIHNVRVRPTMWLQLPALDVEVGDQVEVLARHGSNEPGIFRVREVLYDQRFQLIQYQLERRGLALSRMFDRTDFRALRKKHQLRVNFFEHEPPKSRLPDDIDLLDVGKVL